MMGFQWHQLDHMQIMCTSLQTDNHASTSSPNFFTGRMPFLMPNQQYQSTPGRRLVKQNCNDGVVVEVRSGGGSTDRGGEQISIKRYVSALTLFVAQQEGHPACKN